MYCGRGGWKAGRGGIRSENEPSLRNDYIVEWSFATAETGETNFNYHCGCCGGELGIEDREIVWLW
jgi:hypothetical protein